MMKTFFPRINDYLINRTENQDETLSFDNFTVRFTKSFWERAVEISTEEEKSDGKKVKKSLVMKRVTFETLKNIAPIIDDEFDVLHGSRFFLYSLKNSFIEYIISCLSEGNKKLVSHISPNDIRSICQQFNEKTTAVIREAAIKADPSLEQADLSCSHVFLKELSVLNFEYILCAVSSKLNF